MKTLFDASERSAMLQRIASLHADSARLWGKMSCAQMLAHCSAAMEHAAGDRPGRQMLIGRIFSPLVKRGALGDKPFPKGAPTAPVLVVADARDLEAERARLAALVTRFGAGGPAKATRDPHLFFGRLTGEEWGVLMHKHIDHHLTQFGV
jgi:hypothetical protein